MCNNFIMAFDRLFCPIRSNKSVRKANVANHHQSSRQTAESQQTQQDGSINHRLAHRTTPTSNPVTQFANSAFRYVTQAFEAVQHDELSVKPGDIVLYEFSDFEDGKSWSHVVNLAKNSRGFVPSDILSTEVRYPHSVKKLPRSLGDPSPVDHPHATTRTQCTSEKTCPSNGGSIKLQNPHNTHHPHHHHNNQRIRAEWMQQFAMPPNSFQGSSGCQTFHKFPEFGHPPAYYNLAGTASGAVPPSPPFQYDRLMDCRPFPIDNHGAYMVTHNFVAREESDLNVQPGEVVTVLNKDDDDWYWVRRHDRDEGFVPARFIVPYEQVQSVLDKGNSTVTMKSSNHISDLHTYINHRPDRESLHTDQQSSVLPL